MAHTTEHFNFAAKAPSAEEKAAFIQAAKDGDIQALRKGLTLYGSALANTQDDMGWTPLMFAAAKGHTPCVVALLEGGAEAEYRNQGNWTAKICANINKMGDTFVVLRDWPEKQRRLAEERRRHQIETDLYELSAGIRHAIKITQRPSLKRPHSR